MSDSAIDSLNPDEKKLEVHTSRNFAGWLSDNKIALAISTYQANTVLIVGVTPGARELWMFNRILERPMGMMVKDNKMTLALRNQIVSFVDATAGTPTAGRDPVFVPQVGYYTGDLDVHDLAVDDEGQIVFANTLFNCVAAASTTHSFRPIWRPNFISSYAAGDRCHLNGLALRDGKPGYVTCVASTDITDGWREHRRDGGLVIDVESNEVVCRGLSMPHTPRLHENELWILSAGTGEIGRVDRKEGRFEPLTFCPGYLRGLAFHDNFAIVGMSKPRDRSFSGLQLDERLEKEGVSPRCGLSIVDTRRGDSLHWLRIDGLVTELYDVAVIPNCQQPQMIGFKSDQINYTISIDLD